MRPGLATTLLVLFMLHCSSCTNKTYIDSECLNEIESLMHDFPDSALHILKQTDPSRIRGKRNTADFHLLYSIALDKNGIDIKEDSIIKPAIRFYSKRKASRHKFQSLYYMARIYENREEFSPAMEYLAKAENIEDIVTDRSLAGLLYTSKGRIYNRMLEHHLAASNFDMAAQEYRASGNDSRYFTNRLRAADCLMNCDSLEAAFNIISEIEGNQSELSLNNLGKYFLLRLKISELKHPEQTEAILNEYLATISAPTSIDWLFIADIYLNNKKVEEALDALDMQAKYHGTSALYHYRLAEALAMKEKYQESIVEFMKYDQLSGEIGWEILSQDTKFVEERLSHQNRLEKEKSHRTILSLMIIAVLLALALAALTILAIHKQLKLENLKKEQLQSQIDELMIEREELQMLEERNLEGKKIISERLQIIDQFVMSDAFNDSIFEAKASETLQRIISDRSEFVRQNRLILQESAPRFIEFLSKKGLSDIEIEHCCLYAIGMNGKMVTTFTNAKRHYHIGSGVRKKLGLSTHDTNISIYIRDLYHQMGPDNGDKG